MPNPCDACGGACCREMNSPPFCGDADPILATLSPDVRADYEAGMERIAREGLPEAVPCFWLTPEGRCRHYEHRPDICRNLPPGDPSCAAWRQRGAAEPCPNCGHAHPVVYVQRFEADPFYVQVQAGLWKLTAPSLHALAILAGRLMVDLQCCRRQLAVALGGCRKGETREP